MLLLFGFWFAVERGDQRRLVASRRVGGRSDDRQT
jgi:hypothetical protein